MAAHAPVFGIQGQRSDRNASVAQADLDLARVARWVQAGLGGPSPVPSGGVPAAGAPADVRLFEVPLGASGSGYVSMTTLPEGPIALLDPGVGGTAVLVRIFVPETGHDEVFMLYVPGSPPTAERPLLTAFHGANASHGTIATFTSYLREAELRDWFLVAPIQSGGPGYSQNSYGTPQSQMHVEAVIRLLLDYYAIDLDRLYGVGFSMGGGSVMGYAARHRDRRRGAFAAVLNHTGTVSLSDTYEYSDFDTKTDLEVLFGGAPTENPFEWTRASSIVLDAGSVLMPGADHMAINLTETPVKTIYGITDPEQYLVNQSIQLDSFFADAGATNHILEPTPESPDTCGAGHCWDTADEILVCDWFETITLDRAPATGTVLTDRSARWGQFDVTVDAPNEFTGFEFETDDSANTITFSGVRNLKEVAFNVDVAGLDQGATMLAIIDSPEPGGDDYRLLSFGAVPSVVKRNGQLIDSACPSVPGVPSWCLDPDTGDFVLHEPGGGAPSVWSLRP